MRILIDGTSVGRHPRLHAASLGLALRGHEVLWSGAGETPAVSEVANLRTATGLFEAARFRAEVVIGAGHPWSSTLRGQLAGAACRVQAVGAELASWSTLDQWAWSGLASFALIEPREAESIRHRPGPLVLERVGLWSDDPPADRPLAEHPDCEILERACERTLARWRGHVPRPVVFLDRDGTLIEELEYLADPEQVRLLPGVAAALARLKAAGFALVVISNQAGVGRGLFPLARVYAVMASLRQRLRAEGVELDAIYFCPHAPDAGCACRKPGTELLERAADDLLLRAIGSAMIGDKAIDVEAGRRAGVLGVLVETGYGREEHAALERTGTPPDRVFADLGAAAEWLVGALEGEPVSD